MKAKIKLSAEDFKNVEDKLAELRNFAISDSVQVIGSGLAASSGYSKIHASGGFTKSL